MRKFKYFLLIFFCIASIYGCSPAVDKFDTSFEKYDGLPAIEQAFRNHQSNLFVASSGIIERILTDDLKPPRHQRLIVRLENHQTLLILYNIDISPRITDLRAGDKIYFRGEYLWNEKGGAVHYVHRDPANRILGGWIEYKGKVYR